MSITLTQGDWWGLLTHFLSLSLLAVGGAITTASDMQRYLVQDQHWLTDAQFTSSIALAQAAPGPNVMFVALMGWNVGLNSAAGMGSASGIAPWVMGLFGVCVAMFGILLPSTTLTFAAARWGHQNRDLRAVRAFKQGMAPIVIALLAATGWILANPPSTSNSAPHWHLWLITAVAVIIVWRTRVHLLWLLGAGGLVGWMGWV
jgi:chromate transporter